MDLTALEQWLSIDLNETNLKWTVAWSIALVATVWNAWDALLDLRAVYRSGRNGRVKASAVWFFRQDAVKVIACGLMVSAGLLAIMLIPGGWVVEMLMWSGYLFAINQVWNAADRWRVKDAIKRAAGRPYGRRKGAA